MTKYQIFMKLPEIPHIHINRIFSSMFATFLDQLLYPYKFHGRDMSGILFFIFASCESLSHSEALYKIIVMLKRIDIKTLKGELPLKLKSRTAWPTKIVMQFLSFSDNLLQGYHISLF